MKMLGCVLFFGRIAAANVAATLAHPQMHPVITNLHAIGAGVFGGRREVDEGGEVLTGSGHGAS